VADLYARQLISPEKYHEEIAWYGYEEAMIEASRIAAHWRPRAQQLLRLNQYLPLSEEFISKQLRLGGVDHDDMAVFKQAIGMVWARDSQKLFSSSIQALYADGYIELDRVDNEWANAMSFTTADQWRHRSLELRREYTLKEDLVALVSAAYKAGVIEEAAAIDLLGSLGMTPTIAQLRILTAKLGILPRIRLVFPAEAGEPIPYD